LIKASEHLGYKLRTIEVENSSKVKNSEPQLTIYCSYKKKSVIKGIKFDKGFRTFRTTSKMLLLL